MNNLPSPEHCNICGQVHTPIPTANFTGMIDIKSLRIGNILSVDGEFWHVEAILGGVNPELYFTENTEYNHILNAEPVPLTPHVLDACQFVATSGSGLVGFIDDITRCWISGYVDGQGIRLIEDSGGRFLFFIQERAKPLHVNSLHQLQNLFYDLLHEELIYTPNAQSLSQ
jgi:hypothetical protein